MNPEKIQAGIERSRMTSSVPIMFHTFVTWRRI